MDPATLSPVSVGLWALVPPIAAILLALVSHRVIPSLLAGVFAGTVVWAVAAGSSPFGAAAVLARLVGARLVENASLIAFLCLLGALVCIVNCGGGTRAYGAWAARRLRSARGAATATAGLGVLIFIDDYFNCLTVGAVMAPITDKFHISREKLAYFIDSTAAPVCILAPISSWTATVVSYLPQDGGLSPMGIFLRSIPLNFYALLTLATIAWFALRPSADFGPMARAERRAREFVPDGVQTAGGGAVVPEPEGCGRIVDIVLPVAVLIVLAVASMLGFGGYWSEADKGVCAALGDADAGLALAVAAASALSATFALYLPRQVLKLRAFLRAGLRGVATMRTALVLLTLAWTLSAVCGDLLGTGEVVAAFVRDAAFPAAILPCLLFCVAGLLTFTTGSSWGMFGILLPISVAICQALDPALFPLVTTSVLAGAVFGDHCSPLSDTSVLASAGAGCDHARHVSTQLPYALVAGGACALGFLVAGFLFPVGYGVALLAGTAASAAALFALLAWLPRRNSQEARDSAEEMQSDWLPARSSRAA